MAFVRTVCHYLFFAKIITKEADMVVVLLFSLFAAVEMLL